LLDKVENDYEQYERTFRELNDKIASLNEQVENYKNSQSSIQNVLLSAQKLADQIIDEAKAKSEEIVNSAEANISIITAREKELSNAFELKASERKAMVESEINDMLAEAKAKSAAIEKATEDSVKRQQMLFDKLKLEIAAFKSDITKKYKEHLELLQKLPDTVPMDPLHITEIVTADFNKVPETSNFMESSVETVPAEVEPVVAEEASNGFIISDISADSEDEI
ncbi:MAG: DivIVA domain-containing protein, partial [Clostridia bacterium]|nr:DivIVA domain-containing protein [Clostridia bacterium]